MSTPILSKADFEHLLYMTQIVEARDPYTAGHLWRVAQMAKLLARQIKLEDTDVFHITLGAYLHDLGKIVVPDQVLNKRDMLESGELVQMHSHAEMGYQALIKHQLAVDIAKLVRYHHEHWDGHGYPHHLGNTDIPLGARLLCIVDAFDAMTSTRPYRTALPIATALERLQANKGIQFDPDLVDAFLAIGEEKLSHIVGHSDINRPLLDCYVCGPVVEMPPDGVNTVYCRVCTGKFNIQRDADGKASLEFADDHGSGEDLLPNPDMQHLHTNFSEFGLFME